MYQRTTAVVTFVIACLLGSVLVTGAAYAADGGNGGAFACEQNSPGAASCLDLKDNETSADQQIWIYSDDPAEGATGLGWNFDRQSTVCGGGSCGAPGPFASGSGLNTRYNGDGVYYVEKKEGSGHDGCAGVSQGLVAWEPCGQDGTRWVLSALGYLINVYYSDQDGQPIAMTGLGTANGSAVTIDTLNSTGYQVWSFFTSPTTGVA